jgi:hypothetical protein
MGAIVLVALTLGAQWACFGRTPACSSHRRHEDDDTDGNSEK